MSPQAYISDRSVPEPNTGCWLWLGSVNNWGYGRSTVGWTRERAAHRLSWIAHRGALPRGIVLRHKCDTPSCVNPEHLELGTQIDNVNDMLSRGRNWVPLGELAGSARLTATQVSEIRRRRLSGALLRTLASDYGVHISTISLLARGHTWKRS